MSKKVSPFFFHTFSLLYSLFFSLSLSFSLLKYLFTQFNHFDKVIFKVHFNSFHLYHLYTYLILFIFYSDINAFFSLSLTFFLSLPSKVSSLIYLCLISGKGIVLLTYYFCKYILFFAVKRKQYFYFFF